ncbi:Alkaline phosphatase [Prosthecochloris aestuarii DSM 271]|uniref:Alkaline phosphatase n=1 Tax=Prosthecochloris aestuarii (strain DSM 271 / SK 413) TaxID=290512 RepID=B4S6A7_PROA2|nr:choice-of-anchor I family protein [Prosthecochloris aestuarii]ACF47209.1 Alkaline phosphatase [Prosthecochloris aestuarii DSM 271]
MPDSIAVHLDSFTVGGEGAAEISAYDPLTQQLFVTNAESNCVDVFDLSNPAAVVKRTSIDISSYGGGVNSVAVSQGKLAMAIEADNKQDNGSVVVLATATLSEIAVVEVGALPDMVTFSPDGRYILSANEGEPNDDYTVDPDGTVSIIDISNGYTVRTLDFSGFNDQEAALEEDGFRVFGPGADLAADVEPEYITVSDDSTTAYVTLQENNGIAEIDLLTQTITAIHPLGFKDHLEPDNALDVSNKDDGIEITTWPVKGIYMPDSLASYTVDGKTYLVTANEGDSRDYDGFSEEERVKDINLDPTVFPDAATLQEDEHLGRLKITTTLGDSDGDGDYDALYSYGGRSFSIWSEDGQLVYDSGDDIARITALLDQDLFNQDEGKADGRSDDKGAEPEGVTIGEVNGKMYAFVGLERTGGVMAFDISDPEQPEFVQWIYTDGDVAPEGLLFIDDTESPNGDDLLVVSNEVSGTVSVYSLGNEDALSRADIDRYFLEETKATDSASAATAMSTGQKTDAGNIAWQSGDPEGGELTTIAETLRDDYDFAIGVASTVPFSHATPAAFVSHDVARGNKWDIAHEILFDVQPDVVIGGGLDGYFATAKKDAANNDRDLDDNGKNDDYDAFVAGSDGTDYVFVEREDDVDGGDALREAAAEVSLADGEKLFGLFGTAGGNFEYYDVADDPGSPSVTRGDGIDEDPTLVDVTEATLSVLDQDEDGFFVMFEQGDIDWNNHANDYENMIGGVYDLDQAVRAAEAYIDADPNDDIDWSNTLIIVTSDHSNSYLRSSEVLVEGNLPLQEGTPYSFTYPDGEVSYSTTGHTNELVTLQARGAGAELFEEYAGLWYDGAPIVDNTQIYDVMLDAVDSGAAEHVILFIGDGMNIEHELAASRYLYGDDQALAWDDWGTMEDGWEGYSATWDVDTYNYYAERNDAEPYSEESFDPMLGYDPSKGGAAPYPLFVSTLSEESINEYFLEDAKATDSASAGTAMSTGHKTDAGNVAWASGDPEGGELTTIAETLRSEMGYSIGVASTVPFSHATPATFVSHDVARGNKWDIAHEILFDVQPDVVIGGGLDSYFAKATKDAAGIDRDINDNGLNDEYDAFVGDYDGTPYVFVEREEDVDGGQALRDAAAEVSLADGDKLFGLFGTGGGNFDYYDVADAPGSPEVTRGDGIDEDPTLVDVTEATLSVLDQDEDGFFVMFEQGDIDWNNHANDYENMIGGVYDLDQAVRAAEAYVESGENDMDWSNTLIIVTSDHSNSYLKSNEVLGEGNLPLQEGSPYNFTYPDGEVSYSTTGHTNELVTLQARGAGAELFAEYEGQWYEGSDIVDNTQIYDVMREAAFQEGAEHVILFIGDGMNVEHEVAASRYLYGTDQGLAWDDWGVMEDGWSGYASTWDVDTYNHYAEQSGAAPYSQESFDPLIGYDPSRGGDVAFPLNSEVSAAFEGDTIAPAVESFAPADGEVDVLPDSDIVVTFNEIIQRGSGTIEIREGSADGDLVESYDAATSQNLDFDGDTLTIDPTADLVEDTEFFITFADGSVLDLSGNGYEGTEEYNFTTDAVEAAFAATSDDSGSSTGVVLAGIGIVGILAFAL